MRDRSDGWVELREAELGGTKRKINGLRRRSHSRADGHPF
jgi:hypothetical protein